MYKKSIILSLLVIYFFSFDSSGYVLDLTKIDPKQSGYVAHDIDPDTIPDDVLLGCYKLQDGQFVLDAVKRDAVLAEIAAMPDPFASQPEPPDQQ
ncbi:MAG: hypothetical protein AB1403_11280 [Candidatus Riflebacteria bacterium]